MPSNIDYGNREVIITTVVVLTARTSTKRLHYQGMSEQEILDYEASRDTEEVLEDFVRDVEGTPADKMIITRVVDIRDKQ